MLFQFIDNIYFIRMKYRVTEKEYINEIIRISQDVYDNEKATPVQIDLYNSYPHIFVLACVMDRQIDADRAWQIPLKVAE